MRTLVLMAHVLAPQTRALNRGHGHVADLKTIAIATVADIVALEEKRVLIMGHGPPAGYEVGKTRLTAGCDGVPAAQYPKHKVIVVRDRELAEAVDVEVHAAVRDERWSHCEQDALVPGTPDPPTHGQRRTPVGHAITRIVDKGAELRCVDRIAKDRIAISLEPVLKIDGKVRERLRDRVDVGAENLFDGI